MMKRLLLSLLALAICLAPISQVYAQHRGHSSSGRSKAPRHVREMSPKSLLDHAIVAQGGLEILRSISTVEISGVSHRYLLEQSERPEGPWFVAYEQFTEVRDYKAHARLRSAVDRGYLTPNWWSDTSWYPGPALSVRDSVAVLRFGSRLVPAGRDAASESELTLAMSPERVFLTALEAENLSMDKDTLLHAIPDHVLRFTWRNHPVRLFLNGYTSLPTAVQITRPRPASFFWYPWGDISTVFFFGGWTLEPGGLHYPRLLTVESNHLPDYVWHVDRIV